MRTPNLEKSGTNWEQEKEILDPVTRTEQKISIATIASSHMARRAFARYRAIDDDMKKDLVNIIG